MTKKDKKAAPVEHANGWSDVYGYDETVAQDGVWFDYPGNLGSFKMTLMGNKSKAYGVRYDALMKPHRRKEQLGMMDKDVHADILAVAFVETVLLEWKGVHDEGKEIPFNRQNAIALLKKYPKLFTRLVEDSTSEANFRVEAIEEEGKN